jgi:aspartate/methionine/tyrosine aminotransferase
MRAEVDLLELTFESGYRPTLPQIESQLRTDTKLLSITLPHNPTGTTLTLHELQAIVKLTRERGMWLLVDETYREMAFPGHELPVAASLGDHVISVSSLSKTYGLPGLRMGWILTQNPKLQELFLAGKEQIVICGSVLDEEVSYRFLRRRQTLLPQVLKSMTEKREILWKWFHSQDFLEWVEPRGGVVCFPRIRASAGIEVERFYQLLNQKYSTFVGPGHWFELPKTSMRIGYGWPTHEELHEGLKNISRALEEART